VRHCPRRVAPWWLERIDAPYVYCEPVKTWILALKYRRARALGRGLGLLVAAAMTPSRATIDALVPVPLHPSRWRERGYNQALEIATPIGRRFGVPVLVRGIRRIRATPEQAALGAADRASNLAGAFRIDRALAGRRVCIVDDVITTGATANALACALLDAGAAGVMAVAVARTLE
jgi:ComF family protein